VYDPPFELYVGDYAFAYSHELPNELLALFTEQDRRPPAKLETSGPRLLEPEKADSDDSEFTKSDRLNPIGRAANRDTPEAEQGDRCDLDVIEADPDNLAPWVVDLNEVIAEEVDPEDVDPEECRMESAYEVPVSVMRERLEILGFSNALWEEELQDYVKSKIKHGIWQVEHEKEGTPERRRAERRLTILQSSSLQRWMKKLLVLLDRSLNQNYVTEDTLMYAMYDKHALHEPIFTRELIFLRGALEVLRDDETVSFDFSTAVYEDTVTANEPLSETARYRLLRPVREFDPVLVLTEGRTDARIISESIKRMRPEIAHMFSYMDHETFKAEGGHSALVSLARSLAAAKISNRIIFLFDNDTAGHEGYGRFQKVRLPKHYLGLILPYLKSAEAYPTIGPTGEAPANVNGCACGIELYCGPKALTKVDGKPCQVQWKGYSDGMKRYQGEPLDKDGIKRRFFAALEQSSNPKTDPEFEDMRLLLKALTEVKWN
jgi:hypothetical protein